MESTIKVILIGLGFVVAILGIRSKWRYLGQARGAQIQSGSPALNKPRTEARVHRLAVLYVICVFGTAVSLAIFVRNGFPVVVSFIAVAFAVVTAVADILIDLDTSQK